MLDRRLFIGAAMAGTVAGAGAAPAIAGTLPAGAHGLHGKMIAKPGQRDALAAILLENGAAMPGCRLYLVSADAADADALWVTEVWDSKDAHTASLSLPAVKDAIARGRPLIAGFGDWTELRPLGGIGV